MAEDILSGPNDTLGGSGNPVPYANLPVGTTANKVAAGNDARIADAYRSWRSSDVSTMPRGDANSQSATSGLVYGARAMCRLAGTYTKIRFATGSTGSACTQLKAGVWSTTPSGSTYPLRSSTADQSASFVVNTLFDNIALGTSLTLAYGDEVFLGIGIVATSPSITGKAIPASAIAKLTPHLGSSVTGYVSGTLPDLPVVDVSSGATARLPWVELIP